MSPGQHTLPSSQPDTPYPGRDQVCSPTPVALALPSGPHLSRLSCFPRTRSSRGETRGASPHPTQTGTKGHSGHAASGPPTLCTQAAAHSEVASRQKMCFFSPPLRQLAHHWHQGRQRAPSVLIPRSLPSSVSLSRARVLLGPPEELAAGSALFLGELPGPMRLVTEAPRAGRSGRPRTSLPGWGSPPSQPSLPSSSCVLCPLPQTLRWVLGHCASPPHLHTPTQEALCMQWLCARHRDSAGTPTELLLTGLMMEK